MEQINKAKAYIYITLLLAFTSFEFFFRSYILLFLLSVFAIIDIYITQKKVIYSKDIILLILGVSIIELLQLGFKNNINFNGVFASLVVYYGVFSIANIIKNQYVKFFTIVITVIAAYSLVIYLICLIPEIKDFLYNKIATNASLNVEDAIQQGGGRNFIIYNFQTNFIFDSIGYSRNCGPFWEPGMFAVFLIIALFFNIFLLEKPNKYRSIILISALVTTFSTGGFMVALLLIAFYIINVGLTARNILLFIPFAVLTINYVLELEYIGDKTMDQFNKASVGSDESRYGAFITQLNMVEASPLIGGETIVDYSRTKTLASGTLWPFVIYGIPVGIFYYFCLFKSCLNVAINLHKRVFIGVELFILIVALSFSQTILLNMSIVLMIFSALIGNYRIKYV